jgi:hypothetical protein
MEKEPKIEKNNFKEVVLNVEDPVKEMGMRFTISFETSDKNLNSLYNGAIREICEKHKLLVFHQIGSGKETGNQVWEFWTEVTREKLEALLPEIHARAKRGYLEAKKLGWLDEK